VLSSPWVSNVAELNGITFEVMPVCDVVKTPLTEIVSDASKRGGVRIILLGTAAQVPAVV